LSFQHSEWQCLLQEVCDGQTAAFQSHSAIHLTATTNIVFHNCQVSHVGSYAIWFDRGSSNNEIQSCSITDMGTGGIRIGRANAEFGGHTVNNSKVIDGGHVFASGCGIFVQQSSHNTVIHNEVAELSEIGISFGWDWDYDPTTANNNIASFNYIHDLGRYELSDMGGIYTLGISPGTIIQNNVIHSVYTYDYGAWGIYPDQASSNMLIRDNIVFDTKAAGFHQHFGVNNTVVNNIFAFGGEGRSDGAILTDPNTGYKNSFTFNMNIVYLTNGSLFAGDFNPSTNPIREYYFDNNVYWSPNNAKLVYPGNRSLQQWQSQAKQDVNSVIADPLFVNPTNRNFALQPNSPATKLGFKAIDTSKVGPIN